jgi:hypothetical protein
MNRTKLQELCREAGLEGLAEDVSFLCGLEKVLAVLGEADDAMTRAGLAAHCKRSCMAAPPLTDSLRATYETIWHAMWSSRLGEGG